MADVSALWDDGWGERDSNEEPRHHSLLPGLFKGLNSGVRSSGWEGQRRTKVEEDDGGGELMGLTGLETVPRRQKTRDGGVEGVETEETGRATECGIISASSFVPQLFPQRQMSQISPIPSVCVMPDLHSSNGESLD